eukprot:CAMPEP_0170183970 /NCGR_PEP_ID=MMETSP0040_2-20121228/32365_1 /TAXON_ID=641309 /ORGANISM="Lotharella oceanica, Strain CCMP622" /LENGTH=159 /DNA_ID=CAMNT_0010429877 /DNA_START=66 /DNA_END=546 /DNA_ORIENTATION=-
MTPSGMSFRDCVCDNASMAISSYYTGMMPTALPVTSGLVHGDIKGYSPGNYPYSKPYGHWYSFPSKGKCKDGASVGSGCTWQRSETSYIVYGPELVAHGWNRTITPSDEFPDDTQVIQNTEALVQRSRRRHPAVVAVEQAAHEGSPTAARLMMMIDDVS